MLNRKRSKGIRLIVPKAVDELRERQKSPDLTRWKSFP
jgi:hypothetical protein